ncbi:pimeloyl-ACP methyl ester carboxylesterase [Blastococcus colisei]|uniref:Pimeloyl-ACP methyl ester carboxylesterase n=1 Tax=Blastococcus colisei TaxID=1564162 RepID=A0A543PGD4_9ACTN|nr:alpha/beta hydrolase [Blastococcus colisei]TQN43106.1 pimeloyl-ACP methyl ester carboxylesterase [Blastococcus colisei]
MTSASVLRGYPVLGSGALGLAAACSWWALRHQRSLAVARWAPGRGRQRRAGPLHVRVLGSGEPVLLLLHGLAGAGNKFGAAYDELARAATVVVPDLLGFGGSMDVTGPADVQAHLAALDAALDALGLQDRPTVVSGHSMGGVLAIRWAAQHSQKVRSVLTFGAPLYLTRAEADAHIDAIGRMEALLAGDGPLPRAACAWMCRHRTLASWIAVADRPDLPVPVARSGVKHTWDTYSSAMDGLIRDDGWLPALDGLTRVPLTLAAGQCDPVPVPGRAVELARTRPALRPVVHPEADHGLPFTHPDWCRQLIAEALTIEPH